LKGLTAASPLLMLVVAFATGIILWGGFNTFMEATNKLSFCISCHEMRSTVYEEYKPSVHSTNASGVQAVCADCHVPREWTAKLVRKIKASREIYYWLMGTIDTMEKFEARRPELARRVCESLEASDSHECRNCHDFSSMKVAGQARFAARRHAEAAAEGKTCIDCHKGISHRLPEPPKPPEPADPKKFELAGQDINTTCAPCHGRNGQGSPDGTYPRLAGLDADYLARQLRSFKDRSRINIPMFPYST
jgi:cytochrome c-type protein NapC